MNKIKLSYFAGLFDGEGCIMIAKRKLGDTRKSPTYQLQAIIAMVDRRSIDDLFEFFKLGGIYSAGYNKLQLSPAWRWVSVAIQAEKFLSLIREYSVIKREEIEIAMAFQANVAAMKHRSYAGTIGATAHSEETNAYREECRVELQRLKRRFRFHP